MAFILVALSFPSLLLLSPPDTDPIPPGGPCRLCLTDAIVDTPNSATILRMCIRKGAKFVNQLASPTDDLALIDLLMNAPASAEWKAELFVKNENGKYGWQFLSCGSNCQPAVDATPPANPGTIVSVPYSTPTSASQPKGLRIVFSRIGDKTFPTSLPGQPDQRPTVELLAANNSTAFDDTFTCGSGEAKLLQSAPKKPTVQVPDSLMAFVVYPSKYGGLRACSGYKIAENAILTAAHCFDEATEFTNLKVIVGTKKPIQAAASASRTVSASSVAIHPDYNAARLVNDFAVVRLSDGTTNPPLVELGPPPSNGAVCLEPTIFGYGVQPDSEIMESVPYYDLGVKHGGSFKDLTRETCDAHHQDVRCVDRIKFIPLGTGEPQLCHGDSGGAVFSKCGRTTYLIGVATARVGKNAYAFDKASMTFGVPTEANPSPPRRRVHLKQSEFLVGVPLGAPLAFSQGNYCGSSEEVSGFIASRINSAIKAWIECRLKVAPTCPFRKVGLLGPDSGP